jgi:hypothetical protein
MSLALTNGGATTLGDTTIVVVTDTINRTPISSDDLDR